MELLSDRNQRLFGMLIIIIVGGAILFMSDFYWIPSQSDEPLLVPLSPSSSPPGVSRAPEKIGNISLTSSAHISLMYPHSGRNTLSFRMSINVINEGPEDIIDFHVNRTSLFFTNSTHIFTFGVVPSTNYTIPAFQSVLLNFTEDREMPGVTYALSYSPLYFRVLLRFDQDEEYILTTPLAEILSAIE